MQPKERYLFDRKKIDWEELKAYGLTKEKFGKSQTFETMLRTGHSPGLYPVTMKQEDGSLWMGYPQLSFARSAFNGKIGIDFNFQQELSETFSKPFYGYSFTIEEQKRLRTTGNLGKVIDLIHPYNGSIYPSYVSLNPITNQLVAMETKELKLPDEINGVRLDKDDKFQLKAGEIIRFQNNGYLQVNALLSGIETISDYDIRIREINNEKLHIPTHWSGKLIPPKWREELFEGKVISMTDRLQRSYLRMNFTTGQMESSTTFPTNHPTNKNELSAPPKKVAGLKL